MCHLKWVLEGNNWIGYGWNPWRVFIVEEICYTTILRDNSATLFLAVLLMKVMLIFDSIMQTWKVWYGTACGQDVATVHKIILCLSKAALPRKVSGIVLRVLISAARGAAAVRRGGGAAREASSSEEGSWISWNERPVFLVQNSN